MSLERLLDAALPHVAFDGWSPETFSAAAREAGMTVDEARALAPRGAVDLAVAYHRRGDREMVKKLREADLSNLRYSEKVATALRFRLETLGDKEAVRRASTLFSLPTHAAEGGKLVWETADHVWTALGDESRDGNWYSKRAILSGVWASTVLYWLGDDSPGHADTLAFIDRRIEDVMRFEKLKGQLRDNPLTRPLMQAQDALFSRMRAPSKRTDVPGTL